MPVHRSWSTHLPVWAEAPGGRRRRVRTTGRARSQRVRGRRWHVTPVDVERRRIVTATSGEDHEEPREHELHASTSAGSGSFSRSVLVDLVDTMTTSEIRTITSPVH